MSLVFIVVAVSKLIQKNKVPQNSSRRPWSLVAQGQARISYYATITDVFYVRLAPHTREDKHRRSSINYVPS